MKLLTPKLLNHLELSDGIDLEIAEAMDLENPIENKLFQKDFLRYKDASKIEFRRCRFEKVDLNHMDHQRGYDLDVIFENCDLSNANFHLGLLRRVHFKSCKLMGADFSEAMLDQVIFEDCQLDYCNFSETKFKGLQFSHCQLNDASFNTCDLKKVEFSHCILLHTEFLSTPLKDVDLTTCEIGGLLLNVENLRGVIVTSEQAIQLALILGIKIKG